MNVTCLNIEATNKFATNYLNESKEVMSFFDYSYKEQLNYENRLLELKTREFNRDLLVNHIEGFMKEWSTNTTKESLKKFKDPSSVVVIGGQQAGLFTGPLYSIHKVLSVLQLAKQQEQKLGVPVVPVFWIAGEDHDYQEVNHIYLHDDVKVQKFADKKKLKNKPMVSDIAIEEELLSLANEMISFLGETEHSKDVLDKLNGYIKQSNNYVDFFCSMIMDLFKDSPLLLVDSGNEQFKQLQKDFLKKQIVEAEQISIHLKQQQAVIAEAGFATTLDIDINSANLFFYDKESNERILLQRSGEVFENAAKQVSFTNKQLLLMAEETPEKLSNNVVTRPLMQELIFPTLAFIGGPGEISYWAELKEVFNYFEMKMPIIVPRVNITLVDNKCTTRMEELNISIEAALAGDVNKLRDERVDTLVDKTIPSIIKETEEIIQQQYAKMVDYLTNPTLLAVTEKNENLVLDQLKFLKKKVEQEALLKEDVLIRKYNYVDNHLHPQGTYQERVINIVQFMNSYGVDVVKELVEVSLNFDGTHHYIEL